jgi:23S rRNA (adenine2503-C2)-methyltransferase
MQPQCDLQITVSTVGLVPQMREFVSKCKARLAVSLHATTDVVRDWIVPVNRQYNLGALIGALEEMFPVSGCEFVVIEYAFVAAACHFAAQPSDLLALCQDGAARVKKQSNGDRIAHGACRYVMLKGVNDTPEDAARLGVLLANVFCTINLITFNPHEGTQFLPSSADTIQAFQSIVRSHDKLCTVRESKGDDEMAACGQLGNSILRSIPLAKAPSNVGHTQPLS